MSSTIKTPSSAQEKPHQQHSNTGDIVVIDGIICNNDSAARENAGGIQRRRSKGRPRYRTVLVRNVPQSALNHTQRINTFFVNGLKAAFKATADIVSCEPVDPATIWMTAEYGMFADKDVDVDNNDNDDDNSQGITTLELRPGTGAALVTFTTHLEAKRAQNLRRRYIDGHKVEISPFFGTFDGRSREQPSRDSANVSNNPPESQPTSDLPTVTSPPPPPPSPPTNEDVLSSLAQNSDSSLEITDTSQDVDRNSSPLPLFSSAEDVASPPPSSPPPPPPPGFTLQLGADECEVSELDKVKAERDIFRDTVDDLIEKYNKLQSDMIADKTVAVAEVEARHTLETNLLKGQVSDLKSEKTILTLKIFQLEEELKMLRSNSFYQDRPITPPTMKQKPSSIIGRLEGPSPPSLVESVSSSLLSTSLSTSGLYNSSGFDIPSPLSIATTATSSPSSSSAGSNRRNSSSSGCDSKIVSPTDKQVRDMVDAMVNDAVFLQ